MREEWRTVTAKVTHCAVVTSRTPLRSMTLTLRSALNCTGNGTEHIFLHMFVGSHSTIFERKRFGKCITLLPTQRTIRLKFK